MVDSEEAQRAPEPSTIHNPLLTPQDRDDLLAMGGDVADAMASPWEPPCVAQAFRTPQSKLVFTLQVWIDLDAERSPVLQLEIPATWEETLRAIAAFGLAPTDVLTGEDAIILAQGMGAAVRDGFAMGLKMSPADPELTTHSADGFGEWLPTLACLITQCGLSRTEALATPVGQAFALMAAMRRNQGWRVAGEAYALRGVGANDEARMTKDEPGNEAPGTKHQEPA